MKIEIDLMGQGQTFSHHTTIEHVLYVGWDVSGWLVIRQRTDQDTPDIAEDKISLGPTTFLNPDHILGWLATPEAWDLERLAKGFAPQGAKANLGFQ
jgi:hypothetical protein